MVELTFLRNQWWFTYYDINITKITTAINHDTQKLHQLEFYDKLKI